MDEESHLEWISQCFQDTVSVLVWYIYSLSLSLSLSLSHTHTNVKKRFSVRLWFIMPDYTRECVLKRCGLWTGACACEWYTYQMNSGIDSRMSPRMRAPTRVIFVCAHPLLPIPPPLLLLLLLVWWWSNEWVRGRSEKKRAHHHSLVNAIDSVQHWQPKQQ